MTEDQLLAAVVRLCGAQDPPIVWVHLADARRASSGGPHRKGFPDLLLVGAGRIAFRELKAGTVLHADQTRWLARLEQAGQDAAVWHVLDLQDPARPPWERGGPGCRIAAELAALNQPRPSRRVRTGERARQ